MAEGSLISKPTSSDIFLPARPCGGFCKHQGWQGKDLQEGNQQDSVAGAGSSFWSLTVSSYLDILKYSTVLRKKKKASC